LPHNLEWWVASANCPSQILSCFNISTSDCNTEKCNVYASRGGSKLHIIHFSLNTLKHAISGEKNHFFMGRPVCPRPTPRWGEYPLTHATPGRCQAFVIGALVVAEFQAHLQDRRTQCVYYRVVDRRRTTWSNY